MQNGHQEAACTTTTEQIIMVKHTHNKKLHTKVYMANVTSLSCNRVHSK